MEIYQTDFHIERKSDNSPLTQADLAAHHLIVSRLSELTPEVPILSEESESISPETRNQWQQYWLIDPLDGTREFVKRNGEFTVNIALIDQYQPVLGVVYAPASDLLYYGTKGQGAFKQVSQGAASEISVRPFDIGKLVVAGSRSHTDQKYQQFLNRLHQLTGAIPELISMGSSLKICLVAEGKADVYPRIGPTYEWDTAAAHCILREAGGEILDETTNSLGYNRKQSLLNPTFFATNTHTINWADFLQ